MARLTLRSLGKVEDMRSKWPDFLFNVAIRFLAGAIAGGVAGGLIYSSLNRSAGGRPLLEWVSGETAHPHGLYYWLGGWSLAGGIFVLLTARGWLTSASRSDPEEVSDWTELGTPGSGRDWPIKTVVNKTVSIKTVGEDGQQHTYSSMDQVPPELRAEIEALEKEAAQQKGEELSVTERSQTGNAFTSKIIQRKSVSTYKIVDESGVERVYHSLEEMPPEVRAAIAEAENKLKGT